MSIFRTKLKLTTGTKLEWGLYPGGLIIRCIFWFTGRWTLITRGGGGEAYKWQFTVNWLPGISKFVVVVVSPSRCEI